MQDKRPDSGWKFVLNVVLRAGDELPIHSGRPADWVVTWMINCGEDQRAPLFPSIPPELGTRPDIPPFVFRAFVLSIFSSGFSFPLQVLLRRGSHIESL